MSSLERREYTLEELVPFGGGKATQDANRAELARLRAIEVAAREVADIAAQIPVVCDSPELAALERALRGTP